MLIIGSYGSPFICSSENYECQHRNGQLEIVPNVPSIAECRQLCLDNSYCEFISCYYSDVFPASKTSILLEGCETLTECINCESQDINCFIMGSIANVVGTLGDNVLEAINDVAALTCKEKCSNNPVCHWFTYFSANDNLFPNVCFLQTGILGPTLACKECLSGPSKQECFILYEGEKQQSFMLTNTSQDHKIFAFGSESCQLRILAVGGGGRGEHGGGGSGYFSSLSVPVPLGFMKEILVNVGDAGEASTVKINHELCRAEAGNDADDLDGGAGYSGGGGASVPGSSVGGHDGGSDGSDGGGSNGGRGNGLDVTSNQFFAFDLAPGHGGQGSNYCNCVVRDVGDGEDPEYCSCGGGGGGVFVNSEEPIGRGYGGGGQNNQNGYSGVVLIEIFNN